MIRVAFVGAPDSGKTTLAKMVSAGLSLQGHAPAYVHEYARDYITKYSEKPNTVADQFIVFCRQLEREKEMCGFTTKIMYTDSPIMLPYIYAIDFVRDKKDRDTLVYLYNKTLDALHNRYDLVFFLYPFRKAVDNGVRTSDIHRIDKLGVRIKAFLDLHDIKYIELNQDIAGRVEIVRKAILEKVG